MPFFKQRVGDDEMLEVLPGDYRTYGSIMAGLVLSAFQSFDNQRSMYSRKECAERKESDCQNTIRVLDFPYQYLNGLQSPTQPELRELLEMAKSAFKDSRQAAKVAARYFGDLAFASVAERRRASTEAEYNRLTDSAISHWSRFSAYFSHHQ